ncbi:MAG: hypothetical protein ACI4JG_10665 [Acutalibacteraceae bacterium]
MKKSIRILSLLMAFAMLSGIFSVAGSAYAPFKGTPISGQYDDVDSPKFTLEQYASMGLDEVDRMLAKEKIYLNIYIGELDLGSIDTALTSVQSLLTSVSSLLPLLGDAQTLPSLINPAIDGVRRNKATSPVSINDQTDLNLVYALFDLIANLSPIVEKYVNGSLNLGILDSFIAEYVFNVRELAIGALYGLSNTGKEAQYDYFKNGTTGLPTKYLDENNGVLTLLQDLINELLLGKWVCLDEGFDNIYDTIRYDMYGFNNLYDETAPDTTKYDYYGWVHPTEWVTTGLGGCVRVNAGEAAPSPVYSAIDITTNKNGYDFIEALMQQAYNYILVPVLNRDTRPWLRRLCGVEYDEAKYRRQIYDSTTQTWIDNPTYDPAYDGDVPADNSDNIYAKLFNIDAVVPYISVPSNTTLVDYFNTILGQFLDAICIVKRGVTTTAYDGSTQVSWTWDETGNSVLFDNICNVARFVVAVTGDLFFSEKIEVPAVADIMAMNNQQIVAFVVRAILNSSVSWMYIEDDYQTIADVGYRAVEQLAWQDIPQFTYTKPERTSYTSDADYYDAVVNKALDILFDVAVYNLNQDIDMVPASGNDPVNQAGLLQYQGNSGTYETNLVQIAAWAVTNYGSILALDLNCDNANGGTDGLTADSVWQDFDTIINALIPIKGDNAWIASEIASASIVSKTFVFDYILKPIYYLDATNFATIFKRNTSGEFAQKNGVGIIMSLLKNVFELIAPGVFQSQATLDALIKNDLLGKMVNDFVKTLGTEQFTSASGATLNGRAVALVKVALPIVCDVLHLSDDQEFEEMEIYMPEIISATSATTKFQVVNGSSGINTGYTDKNGDFNQDNLYTYKIQSVIPSAYSSAADNTGTTLTCTGIGAGTTIAGGDSVDVTITSALTEGQLIELTINYFIYGEDGTSIVVDSNTGADVALSKTVYAYVGSADKDDDSIESEIAVGDRKIQYEPSIYLSTGRALDKVESYSIRVKDDKSGSAASASIGGVSFSSTEYPFVTMNTTADQIAASMTGEEGLYFMNPFMVATKADGTKYERFAYTYQLNDKGEQVLDENKKPIITGNNAGVPDGEYTATTTVSVAGTTKSVVTKIHLYDDFGLPALFNNAVSANRQKANYDTEANDGAAEGLFTTYQTALKNAARLVLKPKVGTSFASEIAATAGSGFVNKYEELATALENAIKALEPYEKNSGTTALENALRSYSGINFTTVTGDDGPYKVDMEYYEDGYTFFGMRDYVPHTYNRYKDARKRVEGIINSQNFYVPEPFEEGYTPTDEEREAYDLAVAQYNKNVAEKGVVGSIEATYAEHMLKLTGDRLIRLEANTDKLQIVYDLYKNAVASADEGKYTDKSLQRYKRAQAFAEATLATPITANGEPNLRPSQVNQATSEMVAAWKGLAISADYRALDAAITAAADIITANGTPEEQTAYTPDSYKAFYDAYNAAKNVDRNLSNSDANVAKIGELTTALTSAQAALAPATSGEVVIEFSTEDQFLFFDPTYTYTFVPAIAEDSAEKIDYYLATLPDGTPIDGYIVGYGVDIYDEDTVLSMFSNLDNAYAVVTVGNEDTGAYSTGTVVQIYNANTNELEKTYQVILYGDVTGDGSIDIIDSGEIILQAFYSPGYDWEWNSYNTYEFYKAVAADLNKDGSIDLIDAGIVDSSAFSLSVIDQSTGLVMEDF